jgi:hypothetical protein
MSFSFRGFRSSAETGPGPGRGAPWLCPPLAGGDYFRARS